jgi:hypothetical protein
MVDLQNNNQQWHQRVHLPTPSERWCDARLFFAPMVALSVLFTARTVVNTAATLHAPCFVQRERRKKEATMVSENCGKNN